MDQAYKSNIWKFYVASILGGFAFFYNSIESIYYRHFNLSFEQIGTLIAASLIARLVLEIPSGSFADIYGKKKSLIIASIFGIIGLFFQSFGSNFNIFLLGFIFVGFSGAFSSGAGSALLFDSLNAMDKSQDFLKHKSRMNAGFIAVDIISGSLGLILFGLDVRIPYLISLFAMCLVLIIQISMREVLIERVFIENHIKTNINQILGSLKIVYKNNLLLWFIGFSLILYATGRYFSEIISLPFFQEIKRFSLIELSIGALITNTIQAVFVLFSPSIENILGEKKSLFLTAIGGPLMYFAMLLSNIIYITSIFGGFYYAFWSYRENITENYLNKHIGDTSRATILSINSMILSLGAIMFLPVMGKLTDSTDLNFSIIFIATIALFSGILLLVIRELFIKNYSN